jgi:hypothetical protein
MGVTRCNMYQGMGVQTKQFLGISLNRMGYSEPWKNPLKKASFGDIVKKHIKKKQNKQTKDVKKKQRMFLFKKKT